MLRNYLTVGLRALAKNRTYAFINIFGLAIGMAACLLILLYVRYETRYDRWIPDAADTYQAQTWLTGEAGGQTKFQTTPYPGKLALKKDFPQIERIVYAMAGAPVFFRNGQASSTEDYVYVDDNFLDTVHLPLLRGSSDALDHAGNAVIGRSEAVRRFGTDDVVGRTFTLISSGKKRDFKVAAVLKDLPRDSHMRLSAMLRVDFAHDVPGGSPMMLDCWGCLSGWTYVRLRPGTDPKAIEAQFPAWKKRNIPDENEGGMRHNAGDHQNWHLVRVDDVHLGEAQGAAMAAGNDRTTIATFAVIAMLILGMAVVNFTNLATARGSQRAREIALRKLLGASRGRLVAQFIAESLLVASLAMLIALALAELLVRPFAAFLDADLHLTYLGRGGIALPALILIAVVGVLGGLYPAFFLSRFKPALVLRANQSAETPGSGRLRAVLVLAQFAVSIGLIACTAIVYAQSAFARSADPGFRRDHILQIQQLSRRQLIGKGAAIEEQMRHVPGVDAVGLTDIGVATDNSSDAGVWFPGNPRSTSIGNYFVDRGFFDALGMKLLAGRWFDDRRPMDDMTLPAAAPDPAAEKALIARGANIVVNMEAVRKLGFARAADIVGKPLRIQFGSSGPDAGLLPVTVIGVVGDVRLRSIKRPLEPILFQKADTGESFMVVRFHGDPAALKARVERVWKSFTNEVPFDAQFSDDIMLDLYKAEDAQAKSFAAFAFLSVTVACLGLFGLAAFIVERRTKEIGIRKVLGARVRDIVRLLVWQFSKPVIVANLIAWPVAWWVMRGWLNGFDSRIALGPTPFLLAGGLALLIAVATVAGQALRVARANPIHALRYE